MKRITYTSMSCKTAIRLVGVARNQANGFPARLLGCQQVHFLFPDLPEAHHLSEEIGHSIFIAGLEQSEEWCARCGAKVLVPAADVLSLLIPQYEDWTLDDFEQLLARSLGQPWEQP